MSEKTKAHVILNLERVTLCRVFFSQLGAQQQQQQQQQQQNPNTSTPYHGIHTCHNSFNTFGAVLPVLGTKVLIVGIGVRQFLQEGPQEGKMNDKNKKTTKNNTPAYGYVQRVPCTTKLGMLAQEMAT